MTREPTTIPLSRAKALIGAFVGKRRTYKTGEQSIDIIARGVEYADARVLALTEAGPEVRNFFGAVVVPWGEIRAVRVRELDRHERWTDGALYQVAQAADRRAA